MNTQINQGWNRMYTWILADQTLEPKHWEGD